MATSADGGATGVAPAAMHRVMEQSQDQNAIEDFSLTPIVKPISATQTALTADYHCVATTFHEPHNVVDDPNADLEKRLSKFTVYAAFSIASANGNIATKSELDLIEKAYPLPNEHSNRLIRYLRWDLFSMYRKLFALVFTLNMIAIVLFLSQLDTSHSSIVTYGNAATAAAANFCVGVLMRNEHVVNLLFRLACIFPPWSPLIIRRYAAKVYSYGGVHSGCGVSGAVWYIVFCGLLVNQYAVNESAQIGLALTTGLTLMLLLLILVFAHPYMRMRLHDQFEATHRYGGWSAVACLWAQTIVLVSTTAEELHETFGRAIIRSPLIWFLVIITLLLIYPWTRLRSRKVRVEHLSKHATRLHFDYTSLDTCLGIRLTDAPLKETHGFATIPNYKGEPGFTVLVSNAGDWTNKIIKNAPERLWVKGAPTLGVMRVALMFKRVLVVATGSGIGPSLSLLQAYPDYPLRVVWSAQAPLSTYGLGIIKAVYRADPNAIIVDTKKTGRGNLLALAYSMFQESDCEAAIVISNPVVTRKIVYGLEARGIPAYGPIFDS